MGRRNPLETWGAAAILVLLGALLLAWSWGRWPDPMVDFGRELYVPWRLAEGDVLYADVSYINGAFSPYVNAAAFTLFGTALRTIVWLNVLVLTFTAVLIDRLIRPIYGRLAAFASVGTLLGAFAFCQLTRTGNYNFIAPYSHEMTHGLVLSLGVLVLLERYFAGRKPWALAAAGFLLGLVFLTKTEFFVAAAVAAAIRAVLDVRISPRPARSAVAMPALLAGGAAVSVAAAGILLTATSTWSVGTEGVLGAWPYLLGTDVSQLRFFRQGMGWDDPGGNLRRMAVSAAGWIVAFGAPAVLALVLRGRRWVGTLLGAAVAVALLVSAWRVDWFPWPEVGRPLPLALLVLAAGSLSRAWRGNGSPDDRARSAAAGALAVFSLGLLAKIILNTRLYHYGFSLAMPGTVLVAGFLTGEVPRWLVRRGAHATFFRAVACAWIAVVAILHLRVTDKWFDTKTVTVGQGADAFLAGPEGEALNRFVDIVRTHSRPGATLAVVPEGIMVNYLVRRKNPTGFHTLLPPEFWMLGEDRILEGFRRAPPDWVMITNRDVREFGVVGIGEGFGQALMSWIADHYVVEAEIEIPALRGRSHGRAMMGRYEPGP